MLPMNPEAASGLERTMIPIAGDVREDCPTAPLSALTRDVQQILQKFPEVASLPVVDADGGKPIGLISRAIFMSNLARPFYKEIYSDKSCLVFMDKDPLIVEEGLPLGELSILIARGGDKIVSDGFIIVRDGRYAGVGKTTEVLRAMADVHRENSARLAGRREELEEIVLRRTQALTEARDAAEAAARAKTSFLANMSHEIRTPMNAIVGMAHLMQREALSERQRERLQKIDHAARHLLGIINDILDLSKISAGHMSLNEEPIDPGAIVAGVVDMLADLARNKGLHLVADVGERFPELRGDATRLTQALLNYVGNALKFTRHGGVTVRCRIVESSDGAGGERMLLRFEVEDSGDGIAPEVLPRLFSAFQQADDSLTRMHGGTGLGLAITRHLAEMMGGEAGVRSTLGSGSIFWFTANLRHTGCAGAAHVRPSELQRPAAGDAVAQLRAHYRDACVLVVEDEPVNREIACEFLREAGLSYDCASDGSEAVSLVAAQTYSLILMDMQMPVLDGLAATRQIRAGRCGRELPIIAMTANAFDDDRQRCLEAGMNDFISKPFDPDAFHERLLHWLRWQAATRPQGSSFGNGNFLAA